jgi:hypothetical protein
LVWTTAVRTVPSTVTSAPDRTILKSVERPPMKPIRWLNSSGAGNAAATETEPVATKPVEAASDPVGVVTTTERDVTVAPAADPRVDVVDGAALSGIDAGGLSDFERGDPDTDAAAELLGAVIDLVAALALVPLLVQPSMANSASRPQPMATGSLRRVRLCGVLNMFCSFGNPAKLSASPIAPDGPA